ncbi:MAG: leucine-rich repeat domain-containing protein [Bacilli bacterium]
MNKQIRAIFATLSVLVGGSSLSGGVYALWYFSSSGATTTKENVINAPVNFKTVGSDNTGSFDITKGSENYYLAIDQAQTTLPDGSVRGLGINLLSSLNTASVSDDFSSDIVKPKDFSVTWTSKGSTSPFGAFYIPTALTNYVSVYSNKTEITPISITSFLGVEKLASLNNDLSLYQLKFDNNTYTYTYDLTFSYKSGKNPSSVQEYNALKNSIENANKDSNVGFVFSHQETLLPYTYTAKKGTGVISGFNFGASDTFPANGIWTTPEYTIIDGITYPVTEIQENAFKSDEYRMKKITITDNITKIGSNAFTGMKSLFSLVIEGNPELGANVFSSNPALNTITANLTDIPDNTFEGCNSLKTVSLPKAVNIGNNAFSGCVSLVSFTAPSSLKSIGNGVFTNCSTLSYVLFNPSTNGLSSLPANLFSGCSSLKFLYIPKNITSIDINALPDIWSLRIYFEGSESEWPFNGTFQDPNVMNYNKTVENFNDALRKAGLIS